MNNNIEYKDNSKEIIVNLRNLPSNEIEKTLYESSIVLNEGKTKPWKNGLSYRVDKRSMNMGGNQIHIFGRQGSEWAYRYNGQKSEPHKYTSRATNIVKDLVSDVFGIDKSNIQEATIIYADADEMIIDLDFS